MKKKSLLLILLIIILSALFVACTTQEKTAYEKPSNPVLTATADSITVTQPSDSSQYSYEYSKDVDTWQDEKVFSSLQPNTEYTIYMRRKESTKYLASPSSSSKITTLKHANVEIPQNIDYIQNEKTVEVISDDSTIEFSFDGITYSNTKSHIYSDNGEKTIFVRYKATDTHSASIPYELNVFISNFAYGRGTEAEPFVIKTKEQLRITDTRYEDYFYYKLANNLDFDNATVENNLGKIYGEFDGDGHTIKNVIIDYDGHKDSREIGLFGIVYDVKNLTLENITITSDAEINDPPAGVSIGLLAGRIQDSALNCKTSGKMELAFSGNSSAVYIGGFVGANNGSIINCSTNIEIDINSSASASVYVGGFAGRTKEVSESYAEGTIEVDVARPIFNVYAGGMAGNLSDKIENCYTSVSITVESNAATISVGGIVGENSFNAAPAITNSYSVSNIGVLCANRDTYIGGIIGRVTYDGATVENSFFAGNITNSTSGTNPNNSQLYVANTSDMIGGCNKYGGGTYTYEISNCYYSSSSQLTGSNVEHLGNAVNESSFETQNWLETNLDWDADIWLIEDGKLPILK